LLAAAITVQVGTDAQLGGVQAYRVASGPIMMARVLVVDDDPDDREVIARVLGPHYEVEFAMDAQEARGKLLGSPPHILLCDVYMPGESGIELAETVLRTRGDETAVVMVTGSDDEALVERALEAGAYGYLVKPYREGDLLITVTNALRRRRLELQEHAYERRLREDVITKDLATKRAHQMLRSAEVSSEEAFIAVLQRVAHAIDRRDQIPRPDRSRIATHCEAVARRLELPDDTRELIGPAADLRDVGMIAVSEDTLCKPGPLSATERAEVESHPEVGRQLLQGTNSRLLKLAESIALTHHERFDGTGYPQGLRGGEIPIEGRIAAVADSFEALTSDRPYRPAMPRGVAAEIVGEARGSRFDPKVVDAFLIEVPDRAAVQHSFGDRVRRLVGGDAGDAP
jgi:putative two-component system response regulator